MVLNRVKLAGFEGVFNIRITGTQITSVSKETVNIQTDTFQLNLINMIAFPGLINSHDHLEFNLFPQLGDKVYANYVEWGEYIHRYYKKEIDAVLNIPIQLRAKWGVYKNLLCGVTTVVNHGRRFKMNDTPITIFDSCQSIHSVRLGKFWKLKLNNPLKLREPAVIHIGEGTDAETGREINELAHWNILHRKLIGVHGVAISVRQAKKLKALIWCPDTNFFLLKRTAKVDELKIHTTILFGSDSTLTADWDIWKQIVLARKTKLLSDDELFCSLTSAAAKTWNLNTGKIEPGREADIIIVKEKASGLNSFFSIQPDDILMVVQQGKIRLFDEELLHHLDGNDLTGFNKIYINNNSKYVEGNLPDLINQIHQYHPGANFPIHINSPKTV